MPFFSPQRYSDFSQTSEVFGEPAEIDTRTMNHLKNSDKTLESSNSLLESSCLFKQMVEGAQDCICALDADFNILVANRSFRHEFKRLYGTVLHDGDNLLRALEQAPSEQKRIQDLGARALTGDHCTFMASFGLPDYESAAFEISAGPIYDPNKELIGIGIFGREVTARIKAEQAQKDIGKPWRTMIDLLPHAIFALDQDNRIVFINQTCAEAIGADPSEAVGQSLRAFSPTLEEIEQEEKENCRVLETQERLFIPAKPFTFADGQTRTLQTTKIPFTPEGTEQQAVLGISVDITEIKRAEQDLVRQNQRFTAIIEGTTEAVFVKDLEGRYVEMNTFGAALFGLTPKDVKGKTDFALFPPEDAAFIRENDRQVLQNQRTELYEERLEIDGRKRYFLAAKGVFYDYKGEVAGTFGISRDVTDIRRIEEAHKLLVNQSLCGMAIIQDEQLVFMNQMISKMTGYTIDELKALESGSFYRLIHPEDRGVVQSRHQKRLAGAPLPNTVEFRLCHKNGHTAWVKSYANVIDYDGKPAIQVMLVDITKSRNLEDQLNHAQKMEAIGRLAGGVAHDFNNVLMAIKSYSHFALEQIPEDHPAADDIKEIQKAEARAAELTRQLLAFGRRQVFQPQVLDLNKVLHGVEKMLRRLIGEHIEVAFHHHPHIGMIQADPGQIEQMVMNLAVNARDAMPQGGRLQFETRPCSLDHEYCQHHPEAMPGDYVMLVVSDNGVGMSEKTLAHIFEPFYTTKKAGQGTGLGLATVYGIVKQSGGWIYVYSEPEKGTTFKIYFPQASGQPQGGKTKSDALHLSTGHETILVVEDDPMVAEVVRRTLQKFGYQVLCACNGAEALALHEQSSDKIHLLLTDVIMPEMNGKDLSDRLTKTSPKLKVIFMSGYTDDYICDHGILDPAIHFLQKPLVPSTLIQKVRTVLDE